MIDAMEQVMPAIMAMAPDQLRAVIAHAAGLHAAACGNLPTASAVRRVAFSLEEQVSCLTMRHLLRLTAADHGLSVEDITGGRRWRHLTDARHDAMWRIRQVKTAEGHFRYSLPMIAKAMNLKNHTTVLNGVRQHAKRLAQAEAGPSHV